MTLQMEAEAEKALLAIVRDFLLEFKTERAVNQLNINASLERDLGIDSLGRVELFLRIEKAFSIHFEDALMIEANTLKDIAVAIQKSGPIHQTILTSFTNPLEKTELNPLSSKTLTEVLIRRAEADPNRPHIYLQDEHGQEEIIRYGQLLKQATTVAAGLYKLGLKPGQTVAIMLPTCSQFFYAFFGILLAGGIPVPIYPPLRADRIEEYAFREAVILNNAEVRILLTFDKIEALAKLLRVFIKSLTAVTTVELLLKTQDRVPVIPLKPYDPALIQYTSGSTSDPKGVLLSHHNLLSNIRAFGNAIQLSPTDVGVSWLPLYHDMGLIGAWLGSLYHAFPLTVLSPISFINRPERWLWAIHYHRGTVSAGPNFAYELCVRKIDDASIQGLDLSSWRLALNGAEAVDPKTLERFTKKFAPYGFNPEALQPVYGLAESSVALTIPPLNRLPRIDRILRESFEKEQQAVPGKENVLEFVSAGLPIPDHDIRIVNEQGQEVGDRTVGSLHFTGPSAMLGYYRNTEATESIYHDGWWDTGDFAYLSEGEVFITGRKKDIIIKAGRNLYPQEIEAVTAEVSHVRKGCVIAFGAKDPTLGTEKLVVVAETHDIKPSLRHQIISEAIEKISIVLGLPPDEVVLVPPRTLPKTSSGKLQRSLCKAMYLSGTLVSRGLPIQLQVIKLFLKGIGITFLQTVKNALRYLYTSYVGVLLLFFIPLTYIAVTVLSPRAAAYVCRYLASLLLKCAFFRIETQGLDHIKSAQPLIFVSNHASYLDSLLLLAILPASVAFVGKKEILNWPLMGRAVKKLQYPTVDRIDFSKSLNDLEHIKEILQQGRSLVIFPEGTFTDALGLRPFKLGAFKLATESKTPLCPIALSGTRAFLRGNRLLLNWSPIKITLSEPLMPMENNWDEINRLNKLARAAIAKHCGELSIDLISTEITS